MSRNVRGAMMALFLVVGLANNSVEATAHALGEKDLIFDQFPLLPVSYGINKDEEWYAQGYMGAILNKSTGEYRAFNIDPNISLTYRVLTPLINGKVFFSYLEKLDKQRRDQLNLFIQRNHE